MSKNQEYGDKLSCPTQLTQGHDYLSPYASLNIQTFINLYGYSYKNVYELGDIVNFNDPKVRWVRG